MEISNLKATNPGVGFYVLVEDAVPGYRIPSFHGVEIETLWDGSYVMDLLEDEHESAPSWELERIRAKLFNKWLDRARREYQVAISDADPRSAFHRIRFQPKFSTPEEWLEKYPQILEELIEAYLVRFKVLLMTKWSNRGGDDDYYDYLPSLTDIFYALCEFFKVPEKWVEFKDWLVSEEGEEVLDESLYRY